MRNQQEINQCGDGAMPLTDTAGAGADEARVDPARAGVAYHHAGHALALLRYGIPIEPVRFAPVHHPLDCLAQWRGVGELALDARRRSLRRDRALALIVAAYAGHEAELRVHLAAPQHHDERDARTAYELSVTYAVLPRKLCWPGDETHLAYLDDLRGIAASMLDQSEIWAGVEVLAGALLDGQALTGKSARLLIEDRVPTALEVN